MNRELKKKEIAERFGQASGSYDSVSLLQKEIAEDLFLALRNHVKEVPEKVLEFGCGTGHLSRRLLTMPGLRQLQLLDLSPKMLQACENKVQRSPLSKVELIFLSADIEDFPFPTQTELVCSSSTVQWLKDFRGLVHRMGREVTHPFTLALSCFAPGTLADLYDCYEEATGQSLNAKIHFLSSEELKNALHEVGFEILELRSTQHTLQHKSPRKLLRSLKDMGVSFSPSNHGLNKSSLKRFEELYLSHRKTSSGVESHWKNVRVIARFSRIS